MADFYIRLSLALIVPHGLKLGAKFGRHLVSLRRTIALEIVNYLC
jgi:hypothetical protein